MNKTQKPLVLAGAVGVVAVIGALAVGGYLYARQNTQKDVTPVVEQKTRKRASDQFDSIALNERPFVYVEPLAGGRDVRIVINSLKKQATQVEYELEYQAGELLQGAFGEIPLSSLPATKEILLGSRSAGGKTTYHENVLGGTLVSRFSGESEYAHKSDWRFIDNKTRDKMISSKDAKFQLESPTLAQQRTLIMSTSPGYPGELTSTPISSIYVVSAPSTLTGSTTITLRANEESPTAKIAVWDGSSWELLDTAVDGKSLTATAPFAKAYVGVK